MASCIEVLVIFGGAAYTFRTGGHVRVDLLTGHVRPATRAWLRLATLALGVVFLAVVIWVTARSALSAYGFGRVSAVMLYPLWLPMAIIPAGLAPVAPPMLVTLVPPARTVLCPPSPPRAVLPERHAR